MSRQLNRDEVLTIIPHRYENILIDGVDLSEVDGLRHGCGNLMLTDGDREGRDIFLVDAVDGTRTYYPYMFMEFFALGSITLMEDKVKQGLTAVFSSIRKVSINGRAPAGAVLASAITLKSVSSGFYRYPGTISAGGQEICSLEIMAYGVDFANQQPEDKPATKRIAVPAASADEAVDRARFAYKSADLVFADRIAAWDDAGRGIVTAYTYPASHPFTKGHFPGNPIMMGITQVIMAADAVELLAGHLGLNEGDVNGSAEIFREDGSVVCEVKGLGMHMNGTGALPDLISIKMVAFRDLVRPGEQLYCKAALEG